MVTVTQGSHVQGASDYPIGMSIHNSTVSIEKT